MKITAVETVIPDLALNRPFVLVKVHTDAGIVGIGQTADARTAEVVHDLAAQFLLGEDPMATTRLWHTMFDHSAFHGYAGAESRAISALDIALWDIKGKALGQPIALLLGGPTRESAPIYNTCNVFRGRSDLDRIRLDPEGLAEELVAQGFVAVKWTPFNRAADVGRGQWISQAQLSETIDEIERVATAMDKRVDLMIEGHGRWSPGAAGQIVRALDGLPIRWIEDPIAADNVDEWVRLRDKSPVPLAGGERLLTRHQLRGLVERGGVDVLISDVTWCGGITEAKRIADLAELHGIPWASHGNSGPGNLWAAAHVLGSITNAYAAEVVRLDTDPAHGYYHQLVDGPSIVERGRLRVPTEPGLGLTLRDDFAVLASRTTGEPRTVAGRQ